MKLLFNIFLLTLQNQNRTFPNFISSEIKCLQIECFLFCCSLENTAQLNLEVLYL